MYLAVLPELVLIQYLLVDDINVRWFSSGAVEFSGLERKLDCAATTGD